MKILVINWQDIKNPMGGGAEVHMHEIFRRIAAMGHDVTIFSCRVDGRPDEEIIDGIRVLRKGSRSLFNFYVKPEYKKRFSKEGYDIVIDDINKIPFYTPKYVKEPLMAISHHFFGKSIFHEAGYIKGAYVYWSERRVDKIYKNTPFVVVSESTLNEFIQRGFDPANFRIVYNAITQENFPMEVGEKYPYPNVVYFGRLKKYKSPDHLVQAFAIVAGIVRNAQLHFIGRGDFEPTLRQMCKDYGIEKKTVFHGFVSEEKKVELLSKSHCVVNTSMKEGWGITNIESNACGTPVISADVPGLRDSVSPEISGLLYPYGDIDTLANHIYDVLVHEEKKKNLSQGAVNWASLFSWDESARQMLEAMQDVIAKHKAGTAIE